MPCAFIAPTCSGLSRIAKIPPCTFGCKVFTLPSIISGKPVISETDITGIPAAFNCCIVPPVEISSTPSSCNPCANSTIPVLSETLNNARFISID